ncbi:MAG: hypothetical protein ABIQ86_01470 [Steroidobacteraceae bacterium]
MACARYNDALSGVAAGGPVPAGLDAHLTGCAHCRSELALLRQVLDTADQELGQLSVAEPSAGHVPRIRAAVNESASDPAWRARAVWFWPSLATAAALVMTLMLFVENRSSPEPIAAIEPQGSRSPAAAPVPEPVRETVVATTTEERVIAAPSQLRTRRRITPKEPQVLVPPGESRALIELIALVNRERIAPESLSASGEPSADLAGLTPITLQPIEIVPLDQAMNLGT